jgi:hypothetical protein
MLTKSKRTLPNWTRKVIKDFNFDKYDVGHFLETYKGREKEFERMDPEQRISEMIRFQGFRQLELCRKKNWLAISSVKAKGSGRQYQRELEIAVKKIPAILLEKNALKIAGNKHRKLEELQSKVITDVEGSERRQEIPQRFENMAKVKSLLRREEDMLANEEALIAPFNLIGQRNNLAQVFRLRG